MDGPSADAKAAGEPVPGQDDPSSCSVTDSEPPQSVSPVSKPHNPQSLPPNDSFPNGGGLPLHTSAQNNGAQRAGSPVSRSSGLTMDIAAKMKAFSLSRQGTPAQNVRPQPGTGQSASSSHVVTQPGFPMLRTNTQQSGSPVSPTGPLAGGPAAMRLPPSVGRPKVANWNSSPQMGPTDTKGQSRPTMGGLAAKRGIKGGGMKLSDATGPAPSLAAGAPAEAPPSDSRGSAFKKYADMIDTSKGTLNFQNKAVIHGGGIDFSSGSSFSISLDEVDTLGELGKGNYGTVYKVRHLRPQIRRPGQGLRGNMATRSFADTLPHLGSDESTMKSSQPIGGSGVVMAMKEIRLELDDAKFAAIIMELDILHRCISPFIVSFYGAFFQEGSVYICLEFMDGGSIDKIYGDGIPEDVLRKIALSTVMGLRFLKDEHNIIHRDVKPTNILVNTHGQVKICDFGVSGNLVASIAKTNIGCQSYMAPERISGGGVAQAGANPGGGTYSVQSDVWSLGLTIVECALGRYPYAPETYNNIFSQLSAIVDGDPPGLPSTGYSEPARAFVSSCLHKTPKMRPTYAMLMRHAWLSPLLKPPTISEADELGGESLSQQTAQAALDGDASGKQNGPQPPVPETADKEVAAWVQSALQKKLSGKLGSSEKPALHAAPLDQMADRRSLDENLAGGHDALVEVPTEQLPDGLGEKNTAPDNAAPILRESNHGTKISDQVLPGEEVDSVDFAARP